MTGEALPTFFTFVRFLTENIIERVGHQFGLIEFPTFYVPAFWLLVVNYVPSVYSHVDQHFISSVEFSLLSRTISPQTYETAANLAWLQRMLDRSDIMT